MTQRTARRPTLEALLLCALSSIACSGPSAQDSARPADSPVAPATLAAQPSGSALPGDNLCARFAPKGVDLGLENVSALGVTLLLTCALSGSTAVCADRFGGPFRAVADDVDFLSDAGGLRHVIARQGGIVVEPRRAGLPDAVFAPLNSAVSTWGAPLVGARLEEQKRQLRLKLLGADGSSISATILENSPYPAGRADAPDEIAIVDREAPRRDGADEVDVARDGTAELSCERKKGSVRCEGHEVTASGALDLGGNCVLHDGGEIRCFGIDATRGEPLPSSVSAVIPAARRVVGVGGGGCALLADGRVSCFGDLGAVFSDRGVSPFSVPTILEGLEDAVELVGRHDRVCARVGSGRVRCVGCLELGQTFRGLGTGFTPAWPPP